MNLELPSSTNGNTVAVAKITGERGWTEPGGEKKCLCVVSMGLTRRSRVRRGKKCVLGHPTARATSYCLLPDTF